MKTLYQIAFVESGNTFVAPKLYWNLEECKRDCRNVIDNFADDAYPIPYEYDDEMWQ